MTNSQTPVPPDETAVDAGAGAAAPEALPIGGSLRIVALFLALITLMTAGPLVKSMLSVTAVPGGAPVSGVSATGPSVSPLVAAIQFVNFAVPAFILMKFFERRRYVPLLVIAWCVLGLVSAVVSGPTLPPRAFVLKLVVAAGLVSYFLFSKRVKRTFLL